MTGQVEIVLWQERCQCLVDVLVLPECGPTDVLGMEELCWEVVAAGTGQPPCVCLQLLCISPGSWEISLTEGFCQQFKQKWFRTGGHALQWQGASLPAHAALQPLPTTLPMGSGRCCCWSVPSSPAEAFQSGASSWWWRLSGRIHIVMFYALPSEGSPKLISLHGLHTQFAGKWSAATSWVDLNISELGVKNNKAGGWECK